MNQKGFTPLLIALGVVLILVVVAGTYYLGILKNTKYQTQSNVVTSQTQLSSTQSNPTSQTEFIDPDTVDINNLIPSNMTLGKKLYLDFDGNGQKEIVVIGTDKLHTAGAQAGGSIQMPLIDVFKYSSTTKSWEKAAEMNYLNFPSTQDSNGSFLYQIVIIASGKQEGLVITSVVSGSRVNERFEAIIANNNQINVYSFPEGEYKTKGGNVPHQIYVELDGTVIVYEGLYKPTDSNNEPTNGSLKSVFKVNNTGIHLVTFEKQFSNIMYPH